MLLSCFRALSSTIFLSAIIFTIPLAFDVGGRTCGLAFSLALATFYNIYSVLRLITPNQSRFRYALVQVVAVSQWIVIPTLLIWSLNKFSVDSNDHASPSWVERTFNRKRAGNASIQEWLLGHNGLIESSTIGGWDKLLRYTIPLFQVAEGFCSLLVIQAAGQITRWAVNRESGDNWMVSLIDCHYEWKADCIDRFARCLRIYHIELLLLPLPHHDFPRDRQCRRDSDRSCYHLRHLPLRMGHW